MWRSPRSLKPRKLEGWGLWGSDTHMALTASGKGHQVGTHLSAICGMM